MPPPKTQRPPLPDEDPGSPDPAHLRVGELTTSRSHPFDLAPDADARSGIREALGLTGLRKLRFSGALEPLGKADWRLTATLGATVVQDCVITLEPVTTRIDAPVTRIFRADLPELPEGEEIEMPEDDAEEPLTDVIDLTEIMVEALALLLPEYPRADGTETESEAFNEVFAPPGAAPLDEDAVKPLAGLAALRDKLAKPESD